MAEASDTRSTSHLFSDSGNERRMIPPAEEPPSYEVINPLPVVLNDHTYRSPPPAYDDVTNFDGPPPSYQSLFGQVREARKASTGLLDFLRKVFYIILGTIGCTIFVGVSIVIPTAMIVIGTTYRNECPAQSYIPIYLMVGGTFGVIKNFTSLSQKCRRAGDNAANAEHQEKPQDTLLNCFLFAWYVAGCIWIYKVYEPEYEDVHSPNYCNKTLYLFAFWSVTCTFIVLGLVMCCLCCLTIASVISNTD